MQLLGNYREKFVKMRKILYYTFYFSITAHRPDHRDHLCVDADRSHIHAVDDTILPSLSYSPIRLPRHRHTVHIGRVLWLLWSLSGVAMYAGFGE